MSELRRDLSLLDATMINAGTMIASAIFLVPAGIAAQVHSPGLIVLVWAVGGAVSMLGALCVAELGAMFPEAGGQFAYLREAYGPVWGFLYGWAGSVVILPASIAAVAVGFATYAGVFIPMQGATLKLVAVLSIVALTALNCLGVRPGALVQNLLTVLKVGAVALLVALIFVLPGGSPAHFSPLFSSDAAPGLAGRFGVAMVAALWAYDGWVEICYVGSEVKDPGRSIPRSIVWSLSLVIAVYILANVAYLYALAPGQMAASTTVASDAARVVLGGAGALFVAAVIIISMLGANNGMVLTGARIPYAMARSGFFFRSIGTVHPRFATPVAALLLQGTIAALLALTGSYDQLFTYVIFASWLSYGLTAGVVIRLRRTMPAHERPYKTWGYPLTPIAFIAFAAWLMGTTIVETPKESAIGAAILLAGLPVYWYFRRQSPNVTASPIQ